MWAVVGVCVDIDGFHCSSAVLCLEVGPCFSRIGGHSSHTCCSSIASPENLRCRICQGHAIVVCRTKTLHQWRDD